MPHTLLALRSNATGSMLSKIVPDQALIGVLDKVRPIEFTEVSGTSGEMLWDELVKEFHYLGFKVLVGSHLKYLVFSQGRLLGATGWSSAVWKLKPRDFAIGWTSNQRKMHLNRLANNNRFLIFPWVHIPHLASHILACNIRVLKEDWFKRYGTSLALLETFVDPERFKGSSYKAANWIHVGTTKGFAKDGQTFKFHGHPKEVFLYPLYPDFRKQLGCDKAMSENNPLLPLTHRYLLSLNEFNSRRENMLLQHNGWNTKLPPPFDLNEQDLQLLGKEFRQYHALYKDCFGRIEHNELSRNYLQGLMSNLPRKSIEPVALSLMGTSRVRSLQQFLNTGIWDAEKLAQRHREQAAQTLADPLGVFSVDGSDFPKKGKESVGVARQYCGRLGKVDNCQAGVFLAYASSKGYALLDRRLFLPKAWFSKDQKQRWKKCRIPKDTSFQTKPQLALAMLKQICSSQLFPARWITCDDAFGANPAFRDNLPEDIFFLADIPCNKLAWIKRPQTYVPAYSGIGQPPKKTRLKKGQPKPIPVSQIAQNPKLQWQTISFAEGAKGPIYAEVARLRITEARKGLPNLELWLFLRRSLSDGQIKYAFSNAPEDVSLQEMVRVSTLRWPIEQCFQEGKSEIGMDHYEHRSWQAWHRHMTFVFIAQLFLLRLRHHLKKNSSFDSASGLSTNESNIANENV